MAFDFGHFSQIVDSRQNECINELREWVAIPSVSCDSSFRKYCFQMVQHVAEKLKKLGFKTEVFDNPVVTQTLPNGEQLELPPIILASRIISPDYKTVCIYGHLDVQPADKDDGWDTNPFELTISDKDCLVGRGSSDDKGPVVGLLCALGILGENNLYPNINIKVCFEAMEESGSVGLAELLRLQQDKFFGDVDFVCICDTYWLGTKKPCISYGLRGNAYFHLEVSGFKCDLHSGLFGGMVCEPLTDLILLMSKLVDNNGKILIPGIYDDVAPLTNDEQDLYTCIDYDIEEIKSYTGASKLISNKKETVLMNSWRYPSLSIHGIEGAYSNPGDKTVIPRRVIGKFSIRLVPNMDPDKIIHNVKTYIDTLAQQINTPNITTLSCTHANPGWVTDIKHLNYVAAKQAVEKVYSQTPDFTRIGGSIPIATTFDEVLHKNVLLLSVGRSDDGAHSQNEKIDKKNFIDGIKLFGAYFDELSRI